MNGRDLTDLTTAADHECHVQVTCPPQAWLTSRATPPTAADLEPIVNGYIKPDGGLWTSTYLDAVRISGWAEWCRGEAFGPARAHTWILTPHRTARVAVVDSLADLDVLTRLFPAVRRSYDFHPSLDFATLAQVFDGLRLTDAGQWATRLTGHGEPSLYGWDCECVLWFRWTFAAVDRGPEYVR